MSKTCLKPAIPVGAVEIVMLEKLDCILSKSATRPYIYEYKCECVRTHLCIDPSGRQQSPVIRDSPPAIRVISGHKMAETYHAIGAWGALGSPIIDMYGYVLGMHLGAFELHHGEIDGFICS